ncbi:MAG: DUF2812 domain-containing protein [Tissierellia bacterium]|jgi:hypothetical protein|nr:DUF2812 domain-containing protein [Tissierellia bacterium]
MYRIKIFSDPVSSISSWLNSMSAKGYRLVSVNNFLYKFEKSKERYSYSTQFIGANTVRENKEYQTLLEDSGFKTFRAPLNQGNLAFGKIRLRPYVKGRSKLATTFGDFNREILIVETKGDIPEKLLSSNKDISHQYKVIRNAYIQGSLVMIAFMLFLLIKEKVFAPYKIIVGTVIGIFLMYKVITNHVNYKKYKNLSEIFE